MSKEEKKKWMISQIKELNPGYNSIDIIIEEKVSAPKTKPKTASIKNPSTKIIKNYLDKKGWTDVNNDEELDEYLMDKMLEEEKDFRDNETKIHSELDRYNLLLSQTQSQITEQSKLVKHLKEEKGLKRNKSMDDSKLKEE